MSNHNPHAEVAQYGRLDEGERAIESMLAVAYEQRTANMLALYNQGGLWRSAVLRAEFGYKIKERLGLESDS